MRDSPNNRRYTLFTSVFAIDIRNYVFEREDVDSPLRFLLFAHVCNYYCPKGLFR